MQSAIKKYWEAAVLAGWRGQSRIRRFIKTGQPAILGIIRKPQSFAGGGGQSFAKGGGQSAFHSNLLYFGRLCLKNSVKQG